MRSVRSCSAMATYPQSRDLRPFDRYFPELVAPLRAMLPGRCIVDGDIVIALEETRSQLADSERIVVEARALRRLASLPPVALGEEQSTPEILDYRGAGPWTLSQIASLEQFFAARFARPLPVSALDQTPLHDRLGFDHRNAVDVAVHPDSVEGRARLGHLRARGIPFLAFRGPLAGASTGAHVHVGPASPRAG